MLRSLYIRDYALIEELEVFFGEGLNIITGETGAGKSILIGALKLILGERASTEVVRAGARKAIIEGVFDKTDTPTMNTLLEGHGFDVSDSIILRREISSNNSRAFINDTPAKLDVIKEVADYLIDLHGQHEHQLLLRSDMHLGLLDNFARPGALLTDYLGAFNTLKVLVQERKDLQAKEYMLKQQTELFGFQIQEIDEVSPLEGEEAELEKEHRVLENAEHLSEATARLAEVLYEGDQALHDQLSKALGELEELASIDDAFEQAVAEAGSAKIMLAEIAQQLLAYNSNIDFNAERLAYVRDRISALEMLKRKYGGTMEAVMAYRKDIGEKHEIASNFDEAIDKIDERIAIHMRTLSVNAVKLSAHRSLHAEAIEKAIIKELATVGMPDCRFEVRVVPEARDDGWITGDDEQQYAAFARGMDQVEFYIATNPGEDLKPLARVASGGEISRVMLALKTVLAKSERLPILVFDEIDAGISGNIAQRVGESMHQLASNCQIIAITHLPQIAACGDLHFRVSKQFENGRTVSRIDLLSPEESLAEVASLISGQEITDASLESARELMLSTKKE